LLQQKIKSFDNIEKNVLDKTKKTEEMWMAVLIFGKN